MNKTTNMWRDARGRFTCTISHGWKGRFYCRKTCWKPSHHSFMGHMNGECWHPGRHKDAEGYRW